MCFANPIANSKSLKIRDSYGAALWLQSTVLVDLGQRTTSPLDASINPQDRVVVAGPGDIEIVPVNPGYVVVPYYDPGVVFVRPRPGFAVGGAIRFDPIVFVGGAFAPFGWGGAGFGWRSHDIFIDRHPWVRTWSNRDHYAHPYARPLPRHEGARVEHHELRGRGHEERRDERR